MTGTQCVSTIQFAILTASHVPTKDNIREILHAYSMSTQLDPMWYKAWHTWALANFEVVNHLEAGIRAEELLPETLVTHVIAAIRGTDGNFNAEPAP